MSILSNYDNECILLGTVLRYGREAALAVLPNLTADKFVYGSGGALGGTEHKAIWRAVEIVTLRDQGEPFLGNVAQYVKGVETFSYLESLVGRVSSFYQINSLDIEGLRNHARAVHRAGIVWSVVGQAAQLGRQAEPDSFEKFVGKIDDPEGWAQQTLEALYPSRESTDGAGYHPIAAVVDQLKPKLAAQLAGQQVVLLPCGIPSLYGAGLFPMETMALIHGFSSSGKSMFVHNTVNLGTAMGLLKADLKGCVLINSLEMSAENLIKRMAAALAGFNTFTLLGDPAKLDKAAFARFEHYLEFVKKLPILIDDTPGIAMSALLYRFMGIHLGTSGPVYQLSSDYMELFGTSDLKDETNREQELAALADQHFNLMRKSGASVIAISQSTFTDRTWVAGMMGARYSRGLSQKPDIVIEIVNYQAIKHAGHSYQIADGLDDLHLWLVVEKFRDGYPNMRIPLIWQPEYTRLADPQLLGVDGEYVLFEHLHEVERLLATHPTTPVIPIEDTPLEEFV